MLKVSSFIFNTDDDSSAHVLKYMLESLIWYGPCEGYDCQDEKHVLRRNFLSILYINYFDSNLSKTSFQFYVIVPEVVAGPI